MNRTNSKQTLWKYGLFACALAVMFVLPACGKSDERSSQNKGQEYDYPGDWRENDLAEISIPLAHNKIGGCGQYEHRRHRRGNEYLVACTRDGVNWRGYLVFPVVKKVVGPIALDDPPT